MSSAEWSLPPLTAAESGTDRALQDFSGVYQMFSDVIYRYCLSQLRDPTLAEDVAADVFVAAFRAFDRVEHTEMSLRRWLFTVAHNTVVSHHRASRRFLRALERLGRDRPAAPDITDLAALHADAARVFDAMALLRPRDRRLIGLRSIAGLTYVEIAVAVGSEENAARMATQRAMGRLRALLGEGG